MAPKMSRRTKTSAPPPPIAGGGRPRPRAGRGWRIAGLVLLGAAVGTAAVMAWRWNGLVSRVRAALPVRPALTGKPVELGELLAKAEAGAKTRGAALESVAELGRLYHANGYNREADACWRLLRSEQPREARWCYLLADLRRAESDYTGMAALLAATVELAPDYAPAWLRLADLQFKTGQSQVAERGYRQRLALLPRDPYARLGLVRLALQAGRRDEARPLLEQLLKDTPEFSTGHNLYAEMLAASGDEAGASRERWLGRERGRFREAEDPWLDGLHAWCYDFERLCVLGTLEVQTEHSDRAKTYFERAVRCRPIESTGYELLGTLYLKLHDAAKARDTLETGLRYPGISRPSSMYYVNLSHAYRELKQPAEAVRVARRGLEQLGDEFELHDALGVALGDLGRYDEAIAALRRATAINPNDTNSNFNLGVCLLAAGRENEALAALERSLILQPTFPETLLLRGRMEMQAGRWESAEKYLRPLYESHPEQAEVRQLMAHWHLRAGAAAEKKSDRHGAEQHYRDGLAIDRNNAELQVSLGVLYLMQARFGDAAGPLESYHRLQPENPQSCLFLGQTYAALGRTEEARRILTEGIQLAERSGNATTAGHCREMLQQL